ncbi:sporulation integral membrane protein YtvI [Gorillibacterium sp. sgz5001074]|uniref:sporulation integral membrane protein YtvI n=1 Tax=Gorillibacterium sp. sgz5001074 TaxID=3446695 RepID=UPI003F67D817
MNFRTIVGIALGLFLLYGVFTVGSPFLLAMVFAIFLEPLVKLIMRLPLKLNRVAASVTVCTVFTLLLLFFFYLLGAKVFSEVVDFTKKAPGYLQEVNGYVKDMAEGRTNGFYDDMPADLADQLKEWTTNGVSSLTDSLSGILGAVSSNLLGVARALPNMFIWFIVFLVALFLLSMGMPNLRDNFLAFFEEKSRTKVSSVLDDLRQAIFGFIQSQFILCVIVYVMSLIGFLILGVNYPLAVALLVVIVDLLPIVGVGSALMPWAVFSLVTGNTYLGIGLIVMFIVITVVRRTVEPKVLGDAVGIGALPALISLYVGFKLVGVVGLMLGPIVVIIYTAMRKVGLFHIKIKLE